MQKVLYVYLVNDDIHPERMCVFSSIKNAIAYAKDYAEDEIKHNHAKSYEIEMSEDDKIFSLDSEEPLATIEYDNFTRYLSIQQCEVDEYVPEN